MKRCWGGEVRNVSILVAIGVDQDGYRDVLGIVEGAKEDKASWTGFVRHLKERGLKGVRLFVSDCCIGLVETIAEIYPGAKWQRCTVHFYRNVFTAVPKGKIKDVVIMLKAIHAQEDKEAAQQKANAVISKLELMRLKKAAKIVRDGVEDTLSYYLTFPKSIDAACGPITRLNVSCAKSVAAHEWWVVSRMVNQL